MNTFSLYRPEELPAGFSYPPALVNIAQTGQHPPIGQWWFVDATSNAGELFYRLRKHDGRNLVPFAKGDDDIACFDGDDDSGNPAVLMLVLDDSGRRYSFASFANWLAFAEQGSLAP